MEDEVKDTLEICGVGRIWIAPFMDWTDFNKLAEESSPQGYIRQWESRAKLYPDYVAHPCVWELTFLDKIRFWTLSDWVDWLKGD